MVDFLIELLSWIVLYGSENEHMWTEAFMI